MLLFGSLADWGYIANIVLAIMSVFTAIVTACMLCKQHKLQKEQLNAQQLEHQPRFQFNQTEDALIISNDGCEISETARIEIIPMIIIEATKRYTSEQFMTCIPIQYYADIHKTYNYKGTLAKCSYTSAENLIKLKQIVEGVKNRIKLTGLRLVGLWDEEELVKVSDLVKIEYVDIYKVKRFVYYYNMREIPEWLYLQTKSFANRRYPSPLDIRELTVENIIKEISRFNNKVVENERVEEI